MRYADIDQFLCRNGLLGSGSGFFLALPEFADQRPEQAEKRQDQEKIDNRAL